MAKRIKIASKDRKESLKIKAADVPAPSSGALHFRGDDGNFVAIVPVENVLYVEALDANGE